jgi:tetratricopeptide (TPR) repeat protein
MGKVSDEHVVPGEAYRVLLFVTLLGTEIGEFSLAGDIAQALTELRPDLPYAAIVLAMNEFSDGRHDQALKRLQKLLEEFPDSQLGRAMLGTFMQMSGRVGWQAELESVVDDGRDECAVALACSILGRKHAGVFPEEGYINSVPASPANAMWV